MTANNVAYLALPVCMWKDPISRNNTIHCATLLLLLVLARAY